MNKATAWAHLPNAAFIDEVLISLKAHPEKWVAAQDAACDVIAALIAYDDAGQFMKLPVEQLKAMYRLDPHPIYLLLQPAAVVFVET